MTIKFNEIAAAPWNARKDITPESVKELAQSIDEQGLINPITLWRNADGEWLCIAGNRRLAALRALHGADFDGELPEDHYNVFGGDEHEAREVTITENLQRDDVGILAEADAVNALLDLGANVATVAAKLGKSVSWVNRRRKLAALDDAWKARADEVDADALEKIAAFPADVQKKVAGYLANATNWHNMSYYFYKEIRDLDRAKFDAAACRECANRTGAEADLFGVVDGGLGKCTCATCFDKKLKAWQKDEIARLTKGAKEVVECQYWQVSNDATKRRDKKHPCAYVCTNGDGSVEVKWGESRAAKEAAEAKAREEREAADAADRADRERNRAIVSKLEDWKRDTNAETIEEIVAGAMGIDRGSKCGAFAVKCVADEICSWHDDADWAEIVDAFGLFACMAGVSEEDAAWLVARNAESEDCERDDED